MPEQSDDERQSDRGFGGGHRHHEERDDLSVDLAELTAEGHERQVDRVEHDFNRQQQRDQVAAQEYAGRANGERSTVAGRARIPAVVSGGLNRSCCNRQGCFMLPRSVGGKTRQGVNTGKNAASFSDHPVDIRGV